MIYWFTVDVGFNLLWLWLLEIVYMTMYLSNSILIWQRGD